MSPRRNRFTLMLLITIGCSVILIGSSFVSAQRDDDDDFDDAGFDNAGYSPQSQDADSSNQSPSGSASSVSDVDDIDDDDDVDETHVSPQVAADSAEDAPQQRQAVGQYQQQDPQQVQLQRPELSMAQQANYAMQRNQDASQSGSQDDGAGYYPNVAPQRFYAPPNSVLLANVDPAGRDYDQHDQRHSPYRYRRSISSNEQSNRRRTNTDEADVEDALMALKKQQSLIRHKRHSKYIGPVYTYVKTDKHARYKWGVKHKVGKHHG